MMRVGLLADTHDRVPAIAELVRLMQAGGVSMVLHAGDHCSPFSMAPMEAAHLSFAGVFGKNDGDRQGLALRAQAAFGAELFESPHSIEIAGRRILLVHDLGDVNQRSVDAHELVVHGHQHAQDRSERGTTLLVNPGEGCGWLHGTPQAAIVDLATLDVEFLTLDPADWQR
jgi:uncharacterized protein